MGFFHHFPLSLDATDQNQVQQFFFSSSKTIMIVLLWPGSQVLWRGLTVRCLPHQIRFLLFPLRISLRPSCLTKHSWLNVRHEPSCQEKDGGGAAGLGGPQFGISLLFVIHTAKNESRCRSRGREEKKGERGNHQSQDLSLSASHAGNICTVTRNLKQYV